MPIDSFIVCGQPLTSRAKFEARFWAKVNKDGPIPPHRPELGPCWVWTASVRGGGYGQCVVAKNVFANAQRVAWELVNGPIGEGLYVLHECDNKRCVNPGHLRPGTHAENMRDKVVKGLQTRGEAHYTTKLTEAVVLEIRRLHAEEGLTSVAIAARFGIASSHVRNITSRRIWKHVAGPA